MDNRDYEEDDNNQNNYEEQSMLIEKLDCKNIKCRKFLTRSFRKLNKLVNKKRNYTLTKSHQNIVDTIIQYSKVIKPYTQSQMFQRGPVTSKSFYDQLFAHRRCFKAKIIIDGQVIIDDGLNQQQNFSEQQQKSIFKNGNFNLTLQSEPNTTIIYTKNGQHPLLALPEDRIDVRTNRETTTLEPPLHLNVVVQGLERIQSNLATVIVKQNRNGQPSTSSQGMQNRGIVRPNNVYILEESRQMSETFKNIDNSSFLQ